MPVPNTCENQYAEDECHLSDRERCACPDGEFQRNGSCVATCGQQLQHYYHYHYYISSSSTGSLQKISAYNNFFKLVRIYLWVVLFQIKIEKYGSPAMLTR